MLSFDRISGARSLGCGREKEVAITEAGERRSGILGGARPALRRLELA